MSQPNLILYFLHQSNFPYSLSNLERVSSMKRFARQASPPHSIEEGSEREDLNNDETMRRTLVDGVSMKVDQ